MEYHANNHNDDTVSLGTPDDCEMLSLPPSPCVVNFSRHPVEERQIPEDQIHHLLTKKNYLLQKIENIKTKPFIRGLDIGIRSQVDLNPRLQAQWDQACRSASEQFRNIILLQLQEDVAKISAQLCACRPPAANEVPTVDPINQTPPTQAKLTLPKNNPTPLSNVLFPLMWNPPREPPKWKGVKPYYPSGFSGATQKNPKPAHGKENQKKPNKNLQKKFTKYKKRQKKRNTFHGTASHIINIIFILIHLKKTRCKRIILTIYKWSCGKNKL